MFIAYVVIAFVTAAANLYVSVLDFVHAESAVANATRVGLPLSAMIPLGVLKVAGAVGLLVGIGMPAIGVAAAVGLVLYFVGALTAHVRVRWFSAMPYPGGFFLLAVAALTLRLASI